MHCADRLIFSGAKKHLVAGSFSTLRIPYAQEFPEEGLPKLEKVLSGVGYQVYALHDQMIVLSRNEPTVKVWNNKGKAHLFVRLQGKDEFWSLVVDSSRYVQTLVDQIKTAGVHLVRYLALQQPITSAREFSRHLERSFKKRHMPHPEIVEPTQFAVLKQQFEFGKILQHRIRLESEKFLAGGLITADGFKLLLGHYGLWTALKPKLQKYVEHRILTVQSNGELVWDGNEELPKVIGDELEKMVKRLVVAISRQSAVEGAS